MNSPDIASDLASSDLEEIYGKLERQDYHVTTKTDKEFFFSPYSLQQYLLANFSKRHFDEGRSVVNYASGPTWIREDKFFDMVNMLKGEGFKFMSCGDQIIFERDDVFVMMTLLQSQEASSTYVYATSKQAADKIFGRILEYRSTVNNLSFCWIVNNRGDVAHIVEEWDEKVEADLYPFILNFNEYAESFWSSRSNILILIGPPGTGKTTFIKHLISYHEKTSYVTYDESVLDNDQPFASFISDSNAASFIIEDADLFLKPRAEGNGMISRFLNIGDGLIKLKNKKLIFSTNLPSVKDIDSALVRPGRCFDIVDFRSLTRDEAEVVAKKRGLTLQDGKDSYTLAEIFNQPMTKGVGHKIGFY